MVNSARVILFSLLFLVLYSTLFSQVSVTRFPPSEVESLDSYLIGESSSRDVYPVGSGWKLYKEDHMDEAVTVRLPAVFTGANTMIYQRKLEIEPRLLENNRIMLYFLGINYFAEISLNDIIIHKHPGGEVPFMIELPGEMLKNYDENILTIKVGYTLDNETTIPSRQTFLTPENRGGIVRDMFLYIVPKNFISSTDIRYNFSEDLSAVDIKSTINIFTGDSEKDLRLTLDIKDPSGNIVSGAEKTFNAPPSSQVNIDLGAEIISPVLWENIKSGKYTFHFRLFKDGLMTDEILKEKMIFSISVSNEHLLLNNKKFEFRGVTYIPDLFEDNSTTSISKYRKELSLARDMGCNTIRFSRSVPHPVAINVCRELGLFVMVELPMNAIPSGFPKNQNFSKRALEYLINITGYYSQFDNVVAIGAGSSFLPGNINHQEFITKLAGAVKENSGKLSYSSFLGVPVNTIDNVDLYGIELFSRALSEKGDKITRAGKNIGKARLFVSEATYPTFNGSSSGYLVKYSFEAQARYFDDLISSARYYENAGVFINTLADYKGLYTSFYAGYDNDNYFSVGILGKDKGANRISFKTIRSRFLETDKVSIPIGKTGDDSPLYFILTGLGLAVVLALLINSKRKFREDATRALLRPYNFYADIRDHRLLSGFHSNILMLILAGTHSLLIANILYFLRNNILLEKLLLSFGSPWLMRTVSYLCWHPLQAIIYLFIASVVLFFGISLVIKLFSLFLRNKVLFSNIYYVVIWSLLPIVLLLPFDLVIYRILSENLINIYIYVFLLFYLLWFIFRLLKGVYVIFDLPAGVVYFYSFLLFLVVAGSIMFYFQYTESSFDFIMAAIRQFKHI